MAIKILFLVTQDMNSPSGLGRYLPLASALSHMGLSVQIAALHSNFEELQQEVQEINGVTIHYVAPMHVKKKGSGKSYYNASQLIRLMGRATWKMTSSAVTIPADVIHICKPHPMNGIAGMVGAVTGGKRLFVDCDDYEAASNRFSSRWQQRVVRTFEDGLPRYASLVTSNTRFTLNRLRSLGIPENRLVYLPNGVDRARFQTPEQEKVNELRARLKINGKQVVVYVGSMSLPSHPVDLLLQAFDRLRGRLPDVHLLVVGGGEDLPVLKRQADALNFGESITFTGRIPAEEASLYYTLGDVSVDPVYDTLAAAGRAPLKMFESWACGVPFVTQDVGDRRSLAGDPPAALLVRPGSAEDLAEGIEQILCSRELASEMSSRGTRQVQEFYWDRIAEKAAWIYQPRSAVLPDNPSKT